MSIYNTYTNNTPMVNTDHPLHLTNQKNDKNANHNHSGAFESLDLNQAPRQLPPLPIIPVGTVVKVKLDIQPGGYGDAGWLTRSQLSRAIYLKVALTVVAGEYQHRVIYERIGIQGTKVDETGEDIWGRMGRSQLRAILESAYGLMPHDDSEAAQATRRLRDVGALNGLHFAIKVGKERSQANSDRDYNKVAQIITPDMSIYEGVMGAPAPVNNRGAIHSAAMPTHVTDIPPLHSYQKANAPVKSIQQAFNNVTDQWQPENTEDTASPSTTPLNSLGHNA